MKTIEMTMPKRNNHFMATSKIQEEPMTHPLVSNSEATMTNEELGTILNKRIGMFFRKAIRVAMQKPSWLKTALFLYFSQCAAAKKRLALQKQGTHIPSFMIMSITKTCNLRCKGCYSHTLHTSNAPSLSNERISELLTEARQLGIHSVLLAGGEPLTNNHLLTVTRKFPEITFSLFTNGTLIDDTAITELKKQRNVIPVLSIEGNREETDERRGTGMHDHIRTTMSLLRAHGLFFGCSITVTSENAAMVYNSEWVGNLYNSGCRLFIYVDYVPVDKGTESLVLSDAQRVSALQAIDVLKKSLPALFLAFPGDEELFGGCLAAGRGFVHISPSGDLEACPFAPYADSNVTNSSLKSALGSPLLEKIRANHANLTETKGGCALWAQKAWVASLVNRTEAQRNKVTAS